MRSPKQKHKQLRRSASPALGKTRSKAGTTTLKSKRPKNFNAIRIARRQRLSRLARETVQLVTQDMSYREEVSPLMPSAQTHDLAPAIDAARAGTSFYPHYSQLLRNWKYGPPLQQRTTPTTQLFFTRTSALKAVRDLWTSLPHLQNAGIGVLSFASAKRPGGGFLNGGDEQEECLVRATTLYAALTTPEAAAFYTEHRRQSDGSGLHDHAMLYSPSILAIRDNAGRLVSPVSFSVVSSVPVNAAAVRQKYTIQPDEHDFFEDGMKDVLKERMARALRLFEERGDRALVLGAFGSGSSENRIEAVAGLWAELLGVQGAIFANTFDKIVFAVPGKLYQPFKQAYEMRVLQDDLDNQMGADKSVEDTT